MEIEELINRGLQGDEKAINQLYSIYSHKMVGICVKIVGNRMIAEELAHDAFILAISNSPSYPLFWSFLKYILLSA